MSTREHKALKAEYAAQEKLDAEQIKNRRKEAKQEPAKVNWAESPEKKNRVYKIVAGVIMIFALVSACGEDGDKATTASPSASTPEVGKATATSPSASTPEVGKATTASPSASTSEFGKATSKPVTPRADPTNAQVVKAFQSYVDERATSGVLLAKSVTGVKFDGGTVTVTADPSPTVLELSPYKMPRGLAELFGTPIAFDNEEGVWLRRVVKRVKVVSPIGTNLGSATAEEIHHMGTGK
ncbi:hypothetical protein [Branchiibius sp. NY16-3462-2]|uniref:hypothetical protein n=1 Tax=Branchiibius sp. NY16-3462-2 TaxID=1807500 RepID=UPI00079336C5|nr:hypothetical protein [Branchiibius sp. NY16-3462-2]KYH44695.1 hypothetical protein AZH51_03420 [Branchiibius sp. NY16-3462-2]